ncbi:MAG TPA: hypothetical protein VFX97_11975 [Pyrinomonadaceae bacterium]|nr:hypothetical protein [Pyrinomonadaceae bacterium]
MGSQPDSPALSLAKRITARLEKEKLLDVTRVDKFVDSLASGKLREGDWKLAVEAVPKSTRKSTKKRCLPC